MSAPALDSQARPSQSVVTSVSNPGGAGQGGRRAPSHSRAGVHDADAARSVVFAVIQRIEGHLDEETLALDASPNFDFKASNDRKSQGLVDLNQAMRRLKTSDISEDVERRLQTFRIKLAVNMRKIRLHLDAVREITAMLSEAIQSAESDGTYSRNIGPQRSTP